MVVGHLFTTSRRRALLLSATFLIAQSAYAQDAPEMPPIPAIVVPDFVGAEAAQQSFQDALADQLSEIDGIRVAPARCDAQGALISALGMVLRDDHAVTADLGKKGSYVIEPGGAGVANIGGAQFTVEADGSGTISREGEPGEQITVEADGSGTYDGPDAQITLDGRGGGTLSSDQMGDVTIEADGSGTWSGPLGQVVNNGDGSGLWNGEHVIINDGNGRGMLDGQDVEMAPLPPVPKAGKFPLLTKFQLPPTACGYLITLEDRILFDFDKSDLRPDAAETVDALAAAFTTVAPTHLQILGHTDAKGSDDYNLDLSQRRAITVETALKEREVASLMKAEGFGESHPVAPNEIDGKDNPAGRQLNRRVEIFVPN
ncbi:OmpA family protein [Paracoccus sp. (in: a-proteobacteria)]|uniref:OmpA family protein n=1 Tax=Paracoccus sp. TaxID=267 RepID=UPI0028974393|nr:OmpA family protein [Paracoccus sp. (in: a-proteobacteria)]